MQGQTRPGPRQVQPRRMPTLVRDALLARAMARPRLPNARAIVTVDMVYNILVNQVHPDLRHYFYEYSWIFDYYYFVPLKSELDEFLSKWREDTLPNLAYKIDLFDCDDFAELFAVEAKKQLNTNSVGIALGLLEAYGAYTWHAWNVAIVNDNGDLKAVCIEPQLGEPVSCTGTSFDNITYYMVAAII